MDSDQSAAKEKALLRARTRNARAVRTPVEREAASERLAQAVLAFLPADLTEVSCYVSMPAEPPTGALIRALLDSGRRPWLPRIEGDGLAWVRVDRSTPHATGPLGISEPVGAGTPDLASVQLLLMPALAVDPEGRRLGQGGGYYDRALARLPMPGNGGPLRAAVVFDDEVIDHVPTEPHDRSVDLIFTPRRTIRVSTRA